MARTKLSSKGQVVIPKTLRDALKWRVGADLEIDVVDDALTLRPAAPERRLPTLEEVRRVAGMLKYRGPTISIKEMDEGVDAMFRREWKK